MPKTGAPRTYGINATPQRASVDRGLARRGIPYLVGTVGATIVVIAPAAHLDETFLGLAEDPGLQAGLSETFSTHREATDALREAKWGLEAAQAKGGGVVVYGRSRSPLLPRTVAEGQALVQWTLGSLFAYDDAHGTELVTTLATWFYHNRSVKQTAEFLGIHRQTLAYRLGRIEQITGRMLGDLADQTELFLAIKSYRLVGRPSG
ncbi:PucR family transcriptional regulator [Citricoccus nitrophenolicus]|uniref:PucR family transcriptional regulator n=1 Tax=Citricoccus nitrophenolicus TaxID=863575 RepID=UPI0039B3FEF3